LSKRFKIGLYPSYTSEDEPRMALIDNADHYTIDEQGLLHVWKKSESVFVGAEEAVATFKNWSFITEEKNV
jgi:hypothetical protein